jgi:hypothetical protein
MKFKGNSKSLEYQFMAANNVLHKHGRHLVLYTPKQLAIEVLLRLSSAARNGSILEEQIAHFSQLSRAEILCEVAQQAQNSLLSNNEKYGVQKSGFFDHDWMKKDTLQKNVNRLTRQQLCESYGIEDDWLHYKKEITCDDVSYAKFLREHGFANMKGAEITEEDNPMDTLTMFAILGFFEKPTTVEQATDEAARRLLEQDGVNPGIIDRIIRNAFGSLYGSTPDAHERVIKRAREIFRGEHKPTEQKDDASNNSAPTHACEKDVDWWRTIFPTLSEEDKKSALDEIEKSACPYCRRAFFVGMGT